MRQQMFAMIAAVAVLTGLGVGAATAASASSQPADQAIPSGAPTVFTSPLPSPSPTGT